MELFLSWEAGVNSTVMALTSFCFAWCHYFGKLLVVYANLTLLTHLPLLLPPFPFFYSHLIFFKIYFEFFRFWLCRRKHDSILKNQYLLLNPLRILRCTSWDLTLEYIIMKRKREIVMFDNSVVTLICWISVRPIIRVKLDWYVRFKLLEHKNLSMQVKEACMHIDERWW